MAATNTFAFRNEGSAKSLLRGSLYIAAGVQTSITQWQRLEL